MDKKTNPQGFFSALEDLEKRRRVQSTGCQLGSLLTSLENREREKLQQILDSEHIPATAIAEVLEQNGYTVHVSTIRYHRAGKLGKGCKCSATT